MTDLQKKIEELANSEIVTDIVKLKDLCTRFAGIKGQVDAAISFFKPDPVVVFQEKVLRAFEELKNQVNRHISKYPFNILDLASN